MTLFTGLVADLGTVTAVDASDGGVRLTVRTNLQLGEGDSVSAETWTSCQPGPVAITVRQIPAWAIEAPGAIRAVS